MNSNNLKKKIEKLYPSFKSVDEVHAYYQKIISLMPNNVYWLNRDCVTLGCNNNVLKLFGLKKLEEFIGITYEKMGELGGWNEGQAMSMKQDDLDVMSSGVAKFNVEEPPLYDEQGNPIYYISSRVPLFNENNSVEGVVGISVDITKQKNTEKALAEQIKRNEKVNRSKLEFLAEASHEIRGLISNVVGLTNNVQDSLEELKNAVYGRIVSKNKEEKATLIAEFEKHFSEILDDIKKTRAQAYRANDAVTNLSDLHRIQLEGINTDFREVDFIQFIEKIINSTRDLNVNVDIRTNLSSNIPERVLIDKENIYRALLVVIGNAVRFSNENGIVIVTADLLKMNNSNYIVLKVEDFGKGISEIHLNNIFKSPLFSKEEFSENINYKNLSLKLPQAKIRIEASGGELHIESEYGKGTSVTIKLAIDNIEKMNVLGNKKRYNKILNIRSQQVLILEDDSTTQKMHKDMLEALGHEVDVASLGAEAIELIKKNDYSIAMIDIQLPDIDGIQVAKVVKGLKKNTSIIAVTALTGNKNEEYFIDQGFDAVLFKPLLRKQLQEILDIIIDGKLYDE